MTAVGFISEHTAEYILVPRLVSILSPHFGRVVPFYFWSTREGNSMSRQSGPHEVIRLLSIFARRPKITPSRDTRVIAKINTDLFRMAHIAQSLGIPIFAGVPVVTSIADLTLDAPCHWFQLMPEVQDVADTEITMDPDGSLHDAVLSDSLTGPLSADDLVSIVHRATQPMTWDDGIENLRTIRSISNTTPGHTRFPFFSGYKPFHLMLMDT